MPPDRREGRYPRQARNWAAGKLAALADREFQQLYIAYYEASDWDPADPRLEEIADVIVGFAERHRAELERQHVDLEQVSAGPPIDDPVAMALLLSRTASMPPAWERLDQLCREKARAQGLIMS